MTCHPTLHDTSQQSSIIINHKTTPHHLRPPLHISNTTTLLRCTTPHSSPHNASPHDFHCEVAIYFSTSSNHIQSDPSRSNQIQPDPIRSNQIQSTIIHSPKPNHPNHLPAPSPRPLPPRPLCRLCRSSTTTFVRGAKQSKTHCFDRSVGLPGALASSAPPRRPKTVRWCDGAVRCDRLTLPEANIELTMGSVEECFPLPTSGFQGPC